MKIAIAQINPIIGDFDYNLDKIVSCTQKAHTQGCDLVVFSEMVLTGYPPRDLLERRDFIDASDRCLDRLTEKVRNIDMIVGAVKRNPAARGNPLFNVGILVEKGEITQTVCKRLLPTYDVFDEQRYFEPGSESLAFEYRGHRIGLAICEDGWNDPDAVERPLYSIDPVKEMAADGAEMIINISASPFHLGKRSQRYRILQSTARKYRLPVIYANQVGGNDRILFEGGSVVFGADGIMTARALEFEEDLIVLDPMHPQKSNNPIRPASTDAAQTAYAALVMGTCDYVRKCGFDSAVIGLSGGIDSALTACIAADALGPQKVTGIFMPSPYTSQDNYTDTRKLATQLGIGYQTVPIDSMMQAFVQQLAPDFDGRMPGITEQNLQARIRGTILMAHSNRHGALVLSTGNKSELAVGYCTLYGDMNGGLAVISDVPKMIAYDISRFINREGERIPERIITKAPSAELKPDQTDQDDLPDYPVLDAILQAYIEQRQTIDEIVAAGFDRTVVLDVAQRVHRNEYKRHQAAPGLKITSKAFGEGRRFPIAQRYRLG